MIGEGRESKKDNDLFYTCSLIDYIARKTKNTRVDVVNTLGKKNLDKIYDLAEVYKRLIKKVSESEGITVIDALIKVYNSFISEKIDDYNSSVYYENPSYIYESYKENKIL